MKRAIAALAIMLALTGCKKVETGAEQNLRLAIECNEGGGEWVTVGKCGAWESTYQVCEFRQKEKS